ncbi:MAG: adenylate/guanylate cyclase domain-containing protein [Inquilinaceae bacterium]
MNLVNRLRLGSGLVMFSYVLCHLVNHVLGLFSVEIMQAGLRVSFAIWGSLPVTVLLYGALLVHVFIALRSIWRRRSLRMNQWEAMQLLLGLAIPILLAEHVTATRAAQILFGVEAGYSSVLYVFWVASPLRGLIQAFALIVVWMHGCIGLHYWLRLKPWYPAALPTLRSVALLVPALSLAGFVAAGWEVRGLALEPGWVAAVTAPVATRPEVGAFIAERSGQVQVGFVFLVAGVFAARGMRLVLGKRRSAPRLTYPGGRVAIVPPGGTVLDTSRAAGIAHASVCGGRGRCSTCRVHVDKGLETLPQVSAEERRVLTRIGARDGIRLACQLRPTADLTITPQLSPQTAVRENTNRPDFLQGDEREIAVLFADMRGFTALSHDRLPFDVVFLLNRYFAAMGDAVEQSQGRLDKFIGDGVMALFGVRAGPEEGCRRALLAARAMARNLSALNHDLSSELPAPLRIGIGIHVGPAIVGEMGFGSVKSLTAIGDAVNIASRLEGLTKAFQAELVVSERVARRAGVDLSAFELRRTIIRGRPRPLAVRVVPMAGDLTIPDRVPEARGSADQR